MGSQKVEIRSDLGCEESFRVCLLRPEFGPARATKREAVQMAKNEVKTTLGRPEISG